MCVQLGMAPYVLPIAPGVEVTAILTMGGTTEMMPDGTSAKGDYQMFDNMAVLADGSLILQADVGNNARSGKMWKFDPKSGEMVSWLALIPLCSATLTRLLGLSKRARLPGTKTLLA